MPNLSPELLERLLADYLRRMKDNADSLLMRPFGTGLGEGGPQSLIPDGLRGIRIPIKRGRGMLNRPAALEAFLACLDLEAIDKDRIRGILREMHPFDLGDLQESLDELEALIIEVRGEKTITAEMLEGEGGYNPWE